MVLIKGASVLLLLALSFFINLFCIFACSFCCCCCCCCFCLIAFHVLSISREILELLACTENISQLIIKGASASTQYHLFWQINSFNQSQPCVIQVRRLGLQTRHASNEYLGLRYCKSTLLLNLCLLYHWNEQAVGNQSKIFE